MNLLKKKKKGVESEEKGKYLAYHPAWKCVSLLFLHSHGNAWIPLVPPSTKVKSIEKVSQIPSILKILYLAIYSSFYLLYDVLWRINKTLKI